jgi:hypothetical protein
VIKVEVALGAHEYRYVGGEVHRRPIERENLPACHAAWLVIHKEGTPSLTWATLMTNFEQAQNQTAIN